MIAYKYGIGKDIRSNDLPASRSAQDNRALRGQSATKHASEERLLSHFAPPRNPLFPPASHPQRKTCRSREGHGRREEVNKQSKNRKRRLKKLVILSPD
jgi:hypothetical protein